MSITVAIQPGPDDRVQTRRVPSERGDFSVLDIGGVSIYVIDRATLDALQWALNVIRADMESVASMDPPRSPGRPGRPPSEDVQISHGSTFARAGTLARGYPAVNAEETGL